MSPYDKKPKQFFAELAVDLTNVISQASYCAGFEVKAWRCTQLSEVKQPREFGAFSAKQLTLFIQRLRTARTMRSFLLDYDANFRGDRANHDNIFKFLRACEYGLPQLFAVVELFQKTEGYISDYSLFLHELSRWFRAEELKNLDEEGIPIQISERFYQVGDDRISLTAKLAVAALTGSDFRRLYT